MGPGGHRGGGDMAIGEGLKVCNCRRKELPATGEVVRVEVEVKITKWPRTAIKAYILKPSGVLLL